MSDEDLPRLVDLSIGVPDGIINCNRLYKLLHLLVGGVRDIQEALGASDEDGVMGLDGPEGQERLDQICDTFKRHSETLQSLDEQLKALEERLKKCCEEKEGASNLLAENEERTKEAIAALEEQLKAGQEALDDRLKLLEEMMANLQRNVQEVKENTERDMEVKNADENRLRELENNSRMVDDLSKEMEALKAQMQDLISERDQMNDLVNRLVDENSEMNAKMGLICAEKDQLNALVDKLAEKAGIGGKELVESAGTTHQLLKDLNCIACDTEVVQRDRDDLPIAPPGKGKPKKVIRKLPKSDALARIRSKRAAGGSFTVTKPDERIFRTVSKDPCASSTTSSSSHRDERF